MAKTFSLPLPQNVNNLSVTFTNADTNATKLAFTASANDSNIKAILACTDDTAAINLRVYITRGGVDYLLGTIRIPTLSGTDGAAPGIDLLLASGMAGLPLDAVGKRYIPMKTGDTLRLACLATMTAAKTLWVSVLGEDY
jgi:hypothetical protein